MLRVGCDVFPVSPINGLLYWAIHTPPPNQVTEGNSSITHWQCLLASEVEYLFQLLQLFFCEVGHVQVSEVMVMEQGSQFSWLQLIQLS